MASVLEIAGWVLDAGWKGADATTATAIALRTTTDPNHRGGLFGLGQGDGGAAQAAAAYAAWTGRGRDWDTFAAYRDNGYLLFMPAAAAAVAAVTVTGPAEKLVKDADAAVDQAAATTQALLSTAETVGKVGGFLTTPGAWDRIVKIGLGVMVVGLGFAYLWKKSIFDPAANVVRGAADSNTVQGWAIPWARSWSGKVSWGRKVPAPEAVAKKVVAIGKPDAPKKAPTPPPNKPPKYELHPEQGKFHREGGARPVPSKNAGTPKTGLWKGLKSRD